MLLPYRAETVEGALCPIPAAVLVCKGRDLSFGIGSDPLGGSSAMSQHPDKDTDCCAVNKYLNKASQVKQGQSRKSWDRNYIKAGNYSPKYGMGHEFIQKEIRYRMNISVCQRSRGYEETRTIDDIISTKIDCRNQQSLNYNED